MIWCRVWDPKWVKIRFKIESNFDSLESFDDDEIDESTCYENQLENEFDVIKEDVNELNGSEYLTKPGEPSIKNNHKNSVKKINSYQVSKKVEIIQLQVSHEETNNC